MRSTMYHIRTHMFQDVRALQYACFMSNEKYQNHVAPAVIDFREEVVMPFLENNHLFCVILLSGLLGILEVCCIVMFDDT